MRPAVARGNDTRDLRPNSFHCWRLGCVHVELVNVLELREIRVLLLLNFINKSDNRVRLRANSVWIQEFKALPLLRARALAFTWLWLCRLAFYFLCRDHNVFLVKSVLRNVALVILLYIVFRAPEALQALGDCLLVTAGDRSVFFWAHACSGSFFRDLSSRWLVQTLGVRVCLLLSTDCSAFEFLLDQQVLWWGDLFERLGWRWSHGVYITRVWRWLAWRLSIQCVLVKSNLLITLLPGKWSWSSKHFGTSILELLSHALWLLFQHKIVTLKLLWFLIGGILLAANSVCAKVRLLTWVYDFWARSTDNLHLWGEILFIWWHLVFIYFLLRLTSKAFNFFDSLRIFKQMLFLLRTQVFFFLSD